MKKQTVYGPEIKAKALVLYSTGMTLTKISRLLGTPISTTGLWVSVKYQNRAKKYRDERKEEQAKYAKKKYSKDNKEEIQKRRAAYFQREKEMLMLRRKNRGDGARWRHRNREKLRRKQQLWRAANPEYSRLYAQQKPDVYAEHAAFRRALLKQATPLWLTPEHRKQMRALHVKARRKKKATGIAHHVDHIIPLQAKFNGTGEQIACGLHVPWNLQVLPGPENSVKWCKLPGPEDWTAPAQGGIIEGSSGDTHGFA